MLTQSTLRNLQTTLADLVAIDSVNPELVPGGAGEAQIAGYIFDWLVNAGLEAHLHEFAPGRPSVVGIARGRGGGRRLLLNGHMDTVGIAGMPQALEPRVTDGKLYGRGAYDMKGGLAACMIAIAEARKLGLDGDVILTAVADEEFAGKGTMEVVKHTHAEGAIVAEFTHLKAIVAHKGFQWLEVETQGVAAHGSRPDLGVDAIVKMGAVLNELESLQGRLQSRPAHPLLGHGSLHASLIQGGHELSTYPERCQLSFERRTLPGETPAAVEGELREILERLAEKDPAFKATLRPGIALPALETPLEAEIVRTVQRAGAKVLGRPLELAGVAYWTDAATLWAAGIPSLLLGPGGAGAHAVEEWVDLDSVAQCAEIYLETIREFC
jgi:acetylornithine deacetylase